jgi:hypothetical protein
MRKQAGNVCSLIPSPNRPHGWFLGTVPNGNFDKQLISRGYLVSAEGLEPSTP